jgi:hypothetical protein
MGLVDWVHELGSQVYRHLLNVGRSIPDGRTRLEHEVVHFRSRRK